MSDKYIEIHDRVESLIDKLVEVCYEEYPDNHMEMAKRILNLPETVSITNKEIISIVSQIRQLESIENSGNPFIDLIRAYE